MHALEAKVTALQKLICHLVEKNERLRMHLHAYESAPKLCNSAD